MSSDMNLQVTEMENNNRRPKLMFEKYTWKINHFSKLNPEEELLSDKFRLNDFTWYIVICPPGDIHDYLQIYLEADKDCANLPKDWKKIANFNLTLINQVNDRWSVRKGFEFEFSADDYYDGRSNFLSFREFNKPGSGFIVNDTCVVEAGIFVTKYVYVNDEYQSVFKIDDNPPKDNDNSSFHEMFIHSFKNIEQTLIPRLERVCLYVPSLVVSQEKRSFRFTEWAFTTLGQILHFMGTKKLKDMDDEACNHLQILWDTVNTFGFDLSWLEDDVEDALYVRSYIEEDAMEVRMAQENVDALEIETKVLRTALIERETELEMAKRNLVKAEEQFEERMDNLDSVLGYGGTLI